VAGSAPLRDPEPVVKSGSGCPAFYAVAPKGYVCVDGEKATLDPHDPVYEALAKHAPNLESPWPFTYGESKGVRKRKALADFETPAWPPGLQDSRDEVAARSTVAWTDELEASGASWLWTSDLGFVRKDRVVPYTKSEFQGIHLGPNLTLPLAFFRRIPRPKYRLESDGRLTATDTTWTRLSWVKLTGRTQQVGHRLFRETAEEAEGGLLWVDDHDATVVQPAGAETPWKTPIRSSADEPSAEHRTWIEIAALSGWLVAYEDDRPVFATLISAGKLGAVKPGSGQPQPPATTPLGSYRIRTKYLTTTLVSDLDDGTDFIHAEVPWSQHFYDKYLLHTAYWHDAWGEGRSGGCVNLSPIDAQWLFGWTDPKIPEGWHAYRTADDDPATVVVIHP
jgi:lipoprotein-anchoring transpeptidase ErfK/SrfK